MGNLLVIPKDILATHVLPQLVENGELSAHCCQRHMTSELEGLLHLINTLLSCRLLCKASNQFVTSDRVWQWISAAIRVVRPKILRCMMSMSRCTPADCTYMWIIDHFKNNNNITSDLFAAYSRARSSHRAKMATAYVRRLNSLNSIRFRMTKKQKNH